MFWIVFMEKIGLMIRFTNIYCQIFDINVYKQLRFIPSSFFFQFLVLENIHIHKNSFTWLDNAFYHINNTLR